MPRPDPDAPASADLTNLYESPLSIFKSFVFHPLFSKQVRSGFRSLSYSHNIKQEIQLCIYQTQGGSCNDPTCSFQHWNDLCMSGM